MRSTLLLVGESQDGDRLVGLVQDMAPDVDVVGCRPAAAEQEIDRLVRTGDRVVDVVPLVLLAGHHAAIPTAGAVRVARAFGPHPHLIVAAAARVEAVAPRERWPQTAVLLVGEAGTDPQANAEVVKAARLLQEGRSLGTVETAFCSGAEPSVAQGLDRAHRLGYDTVVVLAWTLFAGPDTERIAEQAGCWAADRPDVTVVLADPIGPGQELAEVVLERWGELHTGDLRTNCDACHYREH
ncbi:MAG: sirohydrochlorin chelatase [Frankiales bacterium]|nr:sirohydrochlorin chelatase [Frankiales bacterium]